MNKETLLSVARQAVKAVPEVVQYLSEATKAELLGYPPIRANYWAEIYDSVEQYLTGDKPVTRFRNKASQAVSESFTDAVYEGYAQAGAELPLPDDIQAWLSQRIGEERTHIEGMFDRLKQEWEGLDWIKEAYARADGYAKTLDMVFQEAKMRGADNATLVFVGDDGAESCPDCQRMQGKRHTIKYILAHNLIPKPGNSTYECNGYNCQHYWMNPKTGEIYHAN